MAYGSPVTSFFQSGIGSAGYIIKVDTKTSILAFKVDAVQAQASTSDTPEPATSEVTLAVLYAYLNDSACPDLAFNFGDGTLSIFFKTSVFAYEPTTRFTAFGLRYPQRTTDDDDKLDLIDGDIDLMKAYALERAYQIKKGVVPKFITDMVRTEEKGVRAE